MRDPILPEIISHYPELTLKCHDTTICVWTRTFRTLKQRNPHHWKLDSYLEMKPLRHTECQDKKVFTSLNELLEEEDWVRELLPNGSGEPFDETHSKTLSIPWSCATRRVPRGVHLIRFLPIKRSKNILNTN
ncbi:hypothetical protein TNIN_497421 [Trichonephila inaurata madagascariensis]|uniref:Uncharacterized protein n=1 Tax=Trichonephila inaurata madagascariensis TaxID=2747483 RepID=A0A8X7CED3_9ARAC|nr:hypothetical protein TNIN_497421 [Trichonephila inaurata madagascariensis]